MWCDYNRGDTFKCQFDARKNEFMNVDRETLCIFHAPLEDESGFLTWKGHWHDSQIKRFYEHISELRHFALQEQKKLDLSGVIFPGDANFEGVEFPEVDFSHARFEGKANFRGSKFSDNAIFQEVEFKDRVHFPHAKFNGGSAIFQNATFKAGVLFEGAEFSGGDTSFRDAQFSKSVSFQKVRFDDGDVEFENAEFQEDANFRGVEFYNGRKGFNKTTFINKADFQNAQFLNGCAFFKQAKFYGDTDFSSAAFNEGVDFREAEFKGKANFQTTKFKNHDAFFSNAKFIGGDADFKNAEFFLNAYFENSTFRWSAIFSEAKFRKSAHFGEAKFRYHTYFRNTKFCSGEVNFPKAHFEGKVDFKSSGNNGDLESFQCEVDFSDSEFLGEPIDEVTFGNRTFQQKTSFRDCTFEKAPRFHGCNLHQDTDFTNARFLDRQGDEATKAYRTLKLDMEEKRAREEHLMFYALEMESRQRTTKKKLLKFLSSLYGMTADYGQSVSRPLLWLGCSYLIFATIYTIFFNELLKEHLVHTDNLHLFFHFSLEQIVRPFRALEFSPLVEFLKNIPTANHFLLRFIAAFQSLLSLALLLLFGLAVRWRFKIG